MARFRISLGKDPAHRAASIFIRMQVFVLEGQIAPEDEFDRNDNLNNLYAVAFDGELPVATNRLIIENETTARITRVATLKDYRHQHLGSRLLKAMEEKAAEMGIVELQIHSEVPAIPFYLANDYTIHSEEYFEDGVACRTLKKTLIKQ